MSLSTPSTSYDQNRKEDDFLFTSISASKYQEFFVTKINKRGKRQRRIFAIDGFNIYNCKSSRKGDSGKKSSFLGGLIPKMFNVKRKTRPINAIEEVKKINSKTFQIIVNEKKERKSLVYECQNADNCAEIMAKLHFLRVSI